MVQRKVPSKVLMAHLQQFSQYQDGIITRGGDMNKSRSIQLSDSEAFQSSPSRQSFSKTRKPSSASHVPITAQSPQKQQPLIRTDRSPHYMKPTRSSGAKKDQKPKFSNNWKASVVPVKQPAKTLTRPSSLKSLSTSTQNPSFKSSRESPIKSCKIAPRADMKAQRTTCSSVRKVCPYTFCSLNGHHRRPPLPPLKNFLSERRSLFKAQKTMKQEELKLQRLKVPFKTKVSDIEQIVIDSNSACADAEVDFFIEIYANVKEHEAKPTATGHGHEMTKLESSEELQDQEVNKFMIEENIKQITTNMSDESPELESNSKKDFKIYYDDTVTKEDTLLSLHEEQNEESADEKHLPSCSHEDKGMEICWGGIRFNDWEQLRSSEMDGCDFEATDTEWKEKQFCTSKLEERVVLAVLKEETEFKLESSPENSLEASVKSDKILSTTRLEEIKYLVEEAPQEDKAQECACFEAQPHDTVLDLEDTIESTETRSLIEEVFQNLTNAEDNGGKNETSPDNDIRQKHIFVKDGATMSLSDQIYNASEEECKLNQIERETDKEGRKNLEMKNTETYQDFAKQVESNGYGRKDVHSKNIFTAQDKEMVEAIESGTNKFQGTRGTGTEEKKRGKNWRGEMKHKIPVKEDDEQLRKFNQRKPNFLPLKPDSEREKVILKHQIMDERKSAEQWMLDHALREAVTKLAPVRISKVVLLVEAFEEVMPITQKGKPLKKGSAFTHAKKYPCLKTSGCF